MSAGAGNLLALYTTEAVGAVAVRNGERVVAAEFAAQGQHAPAVLSAVLGILDAAAARLADLDGVVVTTGPGSFTGIRVGLATAQGLAAARGWRVLCCDSLQAVAAAWPGEAPLAVVQDARRGELYAAVYDVRGARPRTLVEPMCAPPEVVARCLARALEGGTPGRLRLVGSGVDLVRAPLHAAAVEVETPDGNRMPGGVARGLLDLARAGGCREVEPQDLEPTYLRKSDAEIRRDALPPGP